LKSGCGNFLTDVDNSASSSRKKGTAMFGAVKALQRPVTFAVVSGLSKAVSWSRFGLEPTCYLGNIG
jgi:hypothetical protein